MTLASRMTILGHHIRLIRPMPPKRQIICKSDLPMAKYDTKPRTHEIGCAEFLRVCLTHPEVRED